jgi:hypothetical protein
VAQHFPVGQIQLLPLVPMVLATNYQLEVLATDSCHFQQEVMEAVTGSYQFQQEAMAAALV